MYEYHGWITLRASCDPDAEDDDDLKAALPAIQARIDEIGPDNGLLDMRWVNGECMIHLFGLRNHRDARGPQVVGLFELVAEKAPGSYGLLYEIDHDFIGLDGEGNFFTVLRLARGRLAKMGDPFLSPFVDVVEDAC